jgi:rhodanese-related sulfurtransferase
LAGLTADALGLSAAMWLVAALTFASGVVVAVRMRETRGRRAATSPAVGPPKTCVEVTELGDVAGAVIVDVRSPEEFAAGHVAGAINIPLDALAAQASRLPASAAIVTVCGKGGGRSERAAEQLRSLGWAWARSLCGGTQAWQAARTGA